MITKWRYKTFTFIFICYNYVIIYRLYLNEL